MGNQMSVPQRAEEQENDSETDAHAVASKRDCVRNGTPVMVSTYTVQLYDEVDLEIRVQEDSVAASSPKTVDTSAVAAASGKNPGKEAKPGAPAAKSHFFLPLSRPVPGRAGDRGEDSSEPGRPDVSVAGGLGHKGASDSMALRPAAAQGPGPHKSPGRTPADHHGLAAPRGPAPLPPESGGAAPAKPKDSGFFNKLFKLDKGQEKAPTVSHQEAEGAAPEDQAFDIPGFPVPAQDVPAERDIAEGVDKGQEVTPVSCSLPRDPEELEIAKEDPQTTAITEDNNSVMSFFKTLVSSNKAETKKDLEDTACKAETVCDGQAGQKTSEIQAKGAKKKHLNSPRLGLSFRRFFRHKGAEKSPARSADLKSDKATVVPQETQGAAKNPTPTETAKEGAKQKGGPPSLPLSKLFWKKSVKEDSIPTGAEENVVCESPVEVRRSQEVDSALQTVDLNDEAEATPAPAEGKLKREERKPPANSLMAFLRQMSVKGDGGTAHSEEINGKDSSYQTPHSPQKAPAPPEPEPAGAGASQKGKEGSAKDKDKDKKTVAESNKPRNNKQEAKEPAPCACVEPAVAVAMVQANTLQNGDRLQKRPEKRRQSLGGFFKGLGPKRMMDAQVQTDPVSIGPVGKPK
ncbi:breast carcinoma-amplified sequence 1 isoform X3 [Pipistrellus kuhlii]|uniref:Brain enriched myelin associated protein 1 n=2 Tax=Pipistrellus kuhlii TaxID=59472 RepID=A0A7J7Y7S8_PIPKU|nr:breast carcinoma-amplified sequence 1 isoform X3 [Pipistrellus kuhlii]KAF6357888.1 brain enriched myelin associated protein 1 [Pipistrellus kuhlii]